MCFAQSSVAHLDGVEQGVLVAEQHLVRKRVSSVGMPRADPLQAWKQPYVQTPGLQLRSTSTAHCAMAAPAPQARCLPPGHPADCHAYHMAHDALVPAPGALRACASSCSASSSALSPAAP